jgi:hypothetical protein
MSELRHLEGVFAILLSGTFVGGMCGPCDDITVIEPRLPPANPGGSRAPAFDPYAVSPSECAAVCGIGYISCTALVLDGDVPAIECVTPNECGAGRRPRGLRAPQNDGRDAPAVWLARAAHLEAASVVAFERLAGELHLLGAPRALIRRAHQAAREESRHAALVGALARARGAVVPPVRVRRPGARSMVAIALENATEGCVRETFAALVAHHQARAAHDRDIRTTMREIARDETSHAALARDVDHWMAPRLGARERARVARARARAGDALIAGWRAAGDVADRLGLPGTRAGRALARRVGEALGWWEP